MSTVVEYDPQTDADFTLTTQTEIQKIQKKGFSEGKALFFTYI